MTSLARAMALNCLKSGASVIIDEWFWGREQRDETRRMVRMTGAIPVLYYLEVPLEVMKARTLRRSGIPPVDSFNIDEESFDQYWRFFQPPDSDEAFTLVDQAYSNLARISAQPPLHP
jgi:predicted kinase